MKATLEQHAHPSEQLRMMRRKDFQPYVGPRPFERADSFRFFGRDREAIDLVSLIIADSILLVYAQSGVGKTSLLNAKVIPLLEKEEECEILPTVRLGNALPRNISIEEVANVFVFNTLHCWSLCPECEKGICEVHASKTDPRDLLHVSLPAFLEARNHFMRRDGALSLRVALFDQSEELFTCYANQWQHRKAFFEQLRQSLADDPLLRVVIAMREEHIAQLEPYASLFPNKLRDRFRLERLGERGAMDAVSKPLDNSGYSFKPGVVKDLVSELRTLEETTESCEVRPFITEYVEPLQLGVTCQNLWERLPDDVKQIGFDDVKTYGNVNRALSEFYEDCLSEAVNKFNLDERALRAWFKHAMITADGKRGSRCLGAMQTDGIPNAALEFLQELHLLRIEWRGDANWCELPHDRFIRPILEANDWWLRDRLKPEQIKIRDWLEGRASEWQRKGHDRGFLLDADDLSKAESLLASPVASELAFSDVLRALVEESRHECQRLQLEQARTSARRLKILAVALLGMMIVSAVLGMRIMVVQARHQREREEAHDQYLKQKADEQKRLDNLTLDNERLLREQTEYSLTEGQLRDLRDSLPPPGVAQKLREEVALDSVAGYLWKKQDVETLTRLMRQSSDLVPERYGIDEWVGFVMPYVDDQTNWPLEVEYNPMRHLDEGRLLYEWRRMATQLATTWGIPAPMRLKIKEDSNLPVDDLHIVSLVGSGSPDRKERSDSVQHTIRQTLSIPSRPGYVLVTTETLSKPLRAFFDQNRGDWTHLEMLKYGGPWWLVPPWTQPVWKAGLNPSWPAESALAVALANQIVNHPELVLSDDSVNYLLQRLSEKYPDTVNESLSARGGIDGITNDLIEIVRGQNYPLTHLEYLLDSLAEYPGLSPEKAARIVVDSQRSVLRTPPSQLPEHIAKKTGGSISTTAQDSSVREPYEEANRWLPSLEPPIRVYVGRSLEGEVVPNDRVSPRLSASLEELRRNFNQQFGFTPPGVVFQTSPDLKANQLRIEVLNQSSKDEDAKPITMKINGATDVLMTQLRLRYWELRAYWLTPEYVNELLQTLPQDLREELERRYSLTDVKIILRGVITPLELERDLYAQGQDEAGFASIRPEQTLNELPWLLRALTFWISAGDDTQRADLIVQRLQETQNARLRSTEKQLPVTQVVELVKSGIEKLEQGDQKAAGPFFAAAVQVDRELASRSFLALYAQRAQVTVANKVAELKESYPLPTPGQVSRELPPTMSARYDIEAFLNKYGQQLNVEDRRQFGLYLLWSYVLGKHAQETARLSDAFLVEVRSESWPAEDKYFLAYLLLSANKPSILPPAKLDQIQDLLSSSLEQFSDEKSEAAVSELLKILDFRTVPKWDFALLSALADTHPRSYWMSFLVGTTLASGSSFEQSKRGLELLGRAEYNLAAVKSDDQARQKAWLDYARGLADITSAQYGADQDRNSASLRGASVLSRLLETVPAEGKNWPQMEDVYASLADAYIYANNLSDAERIMDQGLGRFPNSERLLSSRFFLHLARLETSQALKLAQDALAGTNGKKDYVLFLAAAAQLLTGQGESQYTANQFLNTTNHPYRDYIRMMLYVSLQAQGKQLEANKLLEDRWSEIDPRSWNDRLEQGDEGVWREMLIGYYIGKIDKKEIFGSLETPEAFRQSPLRLVHPSLLGARCEAYFYDALLQGVTGEAATRRQRKMRSLDRAIATNYVPYYEYHMARYLRGRMEPE